jgi:hypothetical protein
VVLAGIWNIGTKRAILKATLPAKPAEAGKPAQPSKEESFMLAAGQREGDIEVLEIDEKAGTVKVNDYGDIVTLNFSDNGVKLAATPALPGVPGAPNPIGGIPQPQPNNYSPIPGAGFNKTIPARQLRLPTPGSGADAGQPGAANGQMNPAGQIAGFSGGSVPQGTASGGVNELMTSANRPAVGSERSVEENVLIYETARAKNEELAKAGVKTLVMPQHPFLGGQQGQTPGQTPAPQPVPLPLPLR